ncbi:MAG TPA: methyltransferase domain-containing protein [Blastocatellia bacterium]|nr:methyltransferase domain-containing protein [Blastocatellia bacterium]
MLTPKRIHEEELLDQGAGCDDDVARNLADLRRINRLLGGTRVIRRAIQAGLNGDRPRSLSLLDVGTGSADIPAAIARWWERIGIQSTLVSLDLSERNLRIARSRFPLDPSIAIVRGDALRLPFAADEFDFVTASQFLHHFKDDEAVLLLSEFARVARRAVIVGDLVRNFVPYWFIRIAGPVLTTSFLTRYDGPLSVLRGFTVEDLRVLAARAGLTNCTVRQVFPYRVMLVAPIARNG